MRNARVEVALGVAWAVEILASRQQAFHQERGFDQIASVVEHVEDGERLSGGAIHKVRPDAVIARGLFEKTHNLREPIQALIASNEATLDTDDQSHDSEAACAGAN